MRFFGPSGIRLWLRRRWRAGFGILTRVVRGVAHVLRGVGRAPRRSGGGTFGWRGRVGFAVWGLEGL